MLDHFGRYRAANPSNVELMLRRARWSQARPRRLCRSTNAPLGAI